MFRLLSSIIGLIVIFAVVGGAGLLYALYTYGQDLPDYRQLANYEPPVMTRVHAGDGRLLELLVQDLADLDVLVQELAVFLLASEPTGVPGPVDAETQPDWICLLYTSPSPRDRSLSRMPSSA